MVSVFLFFICFMSFVLSCPVDNDPLPSGGANCTIDNGCHGGGRCNFLPGQTGTCICTEKFGNPDCSYERHSKDLAGGLQIGLQFIGVGGVGNFIISRIGPAVAQLLIYTLAYYFLCISFCIAFCVGDQLGPIIIATFYIVLVAAWIASFVWGIVDGAAMLQCNMKDGFGYALY